MQVKYQRVALLQSTKDIEQIIAIFVIMRSEILKHGVHALVGGEGIPIILLPGWPQTAAAFSDVFESLCKNHQVWALDPPGTGDSSPSLDGYSTKSISRLLYESVGHVTASPYHLVGHDIGAWIAYTWAAQFPSSMISLTVLDSAIPGYFPSLSFPLPGPINLKLWQFSFNSLPDLPEILTQGREREFLNWIFNQKAGSPEKISQAKRELYISYYSKPGGMHNGFEFYRAQETSAAENVQLAEKKLKMPVLALGGQSGVGNGLMNSMKALAENVTGGTIEDCGHYVMEEQPEAVARWILDFFKTVE